MHDPLVGRVVDGRYEVRARLARGGMATVYEALDTRLERSVALKVMHAHLAADADFVGRFTREAKAAARLSQHPNVVGVFDQGTDGPIVFLVMEHVVGRTLRDLLDERGRLTARQALELLDPVLAALGAAHRAGLVHRDVKPENVLLADDGRVKVADFGLARAIAAPSGTTQGVLLGTVAYLSPEQVEPGHADARSDVYAAGIVLFEMLTGRQPYEGEGPLQVAYRHVHDDVPPPSSRVEGVPRPVDELVLRATRRDPAQRPVDATAMLADLVAARRTLPRDGDTDELARDLFRDGRQPTVAVPRPLPRPESRRESRPEPRTPFRTEPTVVIPAAGPPPERPLPPPPADVRRRRQRGPIALLLLVLLALGLSGAAWYVGAGPGAYTVVPPLVDQSRAQAEAAAQRAGLSVEDGEPAFDEVIPKGQVLRTDPPAGARIRKGAAITLVLSAGPERFDVPALAGRTLEQAERELEAASLRRGKVTKQFSDEPVGEVLRTDPRPGTELPRNTAVALVVSKGIEQVAVPSVVDQPFASARTALEARAFEVRQEEEFSDKTPAGSVTRQLPAKGKVDKGSTVTVWVSKGPPPVPVPEVVNDPVSQARETLEAAGFRVEVATDIPAGPDVVLRQDPGPGGTAPRGSVVRLFVF